MRTQLKGCVIPLMLLFFHLADAIVLGDEAKNTRLKVKTSSLVIQPLDDGDHSIQNSIEVYLVISNPRIKESEHFNLFVEFKNVSNKAISFHIDVPLQIDISVKDKAGKRVAPTHQVGKARIETRALRLAPGASTRVDTRYFRKSGPNGRMPHLGPLSEGGHVLKPGRYTINGKLKVEVLANGENTNPFQPDHPSSAKMIRMHDRH